VHLKALKAFQKPVEREPNLHTFSKPLEIQFHFSKFAREIKSTNRKKGIEKL